MMWNVGCAMCDAGMQDLENAILLLKNIYLLFIINYLLFIALYL